MAISRAKKEAQLKALEALFQEAEGIAFASFSRASVSQVETVRGELRDKGMHYVVAKKTLLSLAAKNTQKGEFAPDDLEGSVAVIVSSQDVVAPAAMVKKFRKDTLDKKTQESVFNFAGALFNGEFLDAKGAAQLADTPTREESLAKIVGMLQSGPQKLHGILQSGLKKTVTIMDQADKFTS